MVVFEILTFILGIIYGYTGPGKENLGVLLRNGLLIGLGLGIIFVVVGLLVSPSLLVLGAWTVTATMEFLEVVILTVLFIIGTWIGDWLEGRSRSREAKVTP
jgi:Na+-driven multidrug efflux pump